MPREPPVTSTARPSPSATVHHLLDRAPTATQGRGATVVGPRVTDRHAADRPEARRDAEGLAERREPLGRKAEEAGAEALVDGGQQHEERGTAWRVVSEGLLTTDSG